MNEVRVQSRGVNDACFFKFVDDVAVVASIEKDVTADRAGGRGALV